MKLFAGIVIGFLMGFSVLPARGYEGQLQDRVQLLEDKVNLLEQRISDIEGPTIKRRSSRKSLAH